MQYEWLSAHLFYTGSLEILLCRLVKPFIEKAGSLLHPEASWFFIRYAEGGPHVRLRLQAVNDNFPVLKDMLEKQAAQFFNEYPSIESYHLQNEVASYENNSLHYVPYIPEVLRYGNAATMMLAEKQFCLSSFYCLRSIQAVANWNIEMALGIAFQMHLAFFHALDADAAFVQGICRQFMWAWLPVKDRNNKTTTHRQLYDHMQKLFDQAGSLRKSALDVWQALDAGCAAVPLQAFADDHRSLLDQYKQADLTNNELQYALRSILHMTHNRLGISNKEEAWCIFIIDRCIQHIYEQVDRRKNSYQ